MRSPKILLYWNSVMARRLPADPISFLRAGSCISLLVKSTKLSTSSGSAMNPFRPCDTRELLPEALETTTGTPEDMASRVVLPKVSVVLGKRKTSAFAKAVERSSPLRLPRKEVAGSRFWSASLAGPSPTTTDLKATPSDCRRSTVLAKSSRFFSHTIRHTRSSTGSPPPPPSSPPPTPTACRHAGQRKSGLKTSGSTPLAQMRTSLSMPCCSSSSLISFEGTYTWSQWP
mmetsp:Transcript_2740/g.6926  ORF Transcript_2740/g.6926 Transcript_2740/m.6926 type:complete len:230 (+) Transcript_2740:129-818(+)